MSLHPPHPFEKFIAPGAAHVPVAEPRARRRYM